MAPKKGFNITDRVACVILAGGQGTRLFPLTQHRCKPAVNFGGRYRLTAYEIGKNCFIEKAIIDQDVKIGNNVRLTNEKGLKTYDGDGIYIRDGIIIVTSNTIIPDAFIL